MGTSVGWRESSRTELLAVCWLQCTRSWPFELQVLERRRVWEAVNQPHAGLGDALTDARERAQLVQRRMDHPVVQDALDLMQEHLALRPIELSRLALEQVVDL